MSSSVFCIEQRRLETRQARKWLICGLIGSLAAHGSIALALGRWQERSPVTEEPIELIIVEEPAPKIPEPPRQRPVAKRKPAPKIPEPPRSRPVARELPKPAFSPPVRAKSVPTAIDPPRTSPVRVSSVPTRVTPPSPIEPPVSSIEPIAPPIEKKPILTAIKPTANAPTVTPAEPIAPSVNRSTRALENPEPRSRESIEAGLGNPAVRSAIPSAVATSAPPLVNRTTGAIDGGNPANRERVRAGFGNSSPSSGAIARSGAPTAVAADRGTPSWPSPKPTPAVRREREGIGCIANCQPPYPSVLNGAEGRAAVRVTVDRAGNVVSVTLAGSAGNRQIDRQALLAARKMRFTAPPDGNGGEIQITVNFSVAGSAFDRQARERREQQDRVRLAREREKKERQVQLERERQERQRQLQQEQRERQAQLERERQERQRQLRLERRTPSPSPLPTEEPVGETETTNETEE